MRAAGRRTAKDRDGAVAPVHSPPRRGNEGEEEPSTVPFPSLGGVEDVPVGGGASFKSPKNLKEALEEEQTTKEALEETLTLELSSVKENHDRALEVANDLKLKK